MAGSENPSLHGTDENTYNFSNQKRGRAVIINNENFRPGSGYDSREGSSMDAEALKMLFESHSFDVVRRDDLTAPEMKTFLQTEASEYDHETADCLVVAVLSHGEQSIVARSGQQEGRVRHDRAAGVDGSHVRTAELIEPFQDRFCKGLCGKPRIFFFQACRGELYDDGVDIHVIPDESSIKAIDHQQMEPPVDVVDDPGKEFIISPSPIFKDFLVMYATPPGWCLRTLASHSRYTTSVGPSQEDDSRSMCQNLCTIPMCWRGPEVLVSYYAFRRKDIGSWFIHSLCKVLSEQLEPSVPLHQVLTRVTRMVAHGFMSSAGKKKQTPVIESMLTKEIYFTKK